MSIAIKIFEVIKYEGENDVLVWRFPGEDFNTMSQLIVHSSQEAVLFKDGVALDLFGAGRYTLQTENIPLLSHLINLPFGGRSPFHCEVYFINKAVSMDVLWGTDNPIPMQDGKYDIIVPVRANGQFGVRVTDSKKLLLNMVGTIDKFDQLTLKKYFKGILLTNIKDYIAKQFVVNQISFLEIYSQLKSISDGIKNDISDEFAQYGIELVNFHVNEISPPDNDPSYLRLKDALARKAEMTVMGYDYHQERTYGLLDKAAANEGPAAPLMNAGMGVGMGLNLGNAVGNAMASVQANISGQRQPQNSPNMVVCNQCGWEMTADAKFCKVCGEKVKSCGEQSAVTCVHCSAKVPKGDFCSECGKKLEPVCDACGREVPPDAKFCLECGNKLN